MPTRKLRAADTAGRKRPAVSYAKRVETLVAERDRRMAEIATMRPQGLEPGSFLDKAQTLLTRGWATATWSAREGILVTVDWLFRMERLRANGNPQAL